MARTDAEISAELAEIEEHMRGLLRRVAEGDVPIPAAILGTLACIRKAYDLGRQAGAK